MFYFASSSKKTIVHAHIAVLMLKQYIVEPHCTQSNKLCEQPHIIDVLREMATTPPVSVAANLPQWQLNKVNFNFLCNEFFVIVQV